MQTDIQQQQIHSLASTSIPSTPPSTVIGTEEDLDEPTCSSSPSVGNDELENQDSKIEETVPENPMSTELENPVSTELKNFMSTVPETTESLISLEEIEQQKISPNSSEALRIPEKSHDEQTLILMITEVENELGEEERHQQPLKRKSDMGVLEIDLPSHSYTSTSKVSSTDVSPMRMDVDTLNVDTTLSPFSGEEKEVLRQEAEVQTSPLSAETEFKPLEIILNNELATSIATQTSNLSSCNLINTPSTSKQLSPMDISQSSPVKTPEICENLPPLPPPIMPRKLSTEALLIPPPRPPKVKRSRPPNLPPLDGQDQTRTIETLSLRIEQIRNLQFMPLLQFDQTVQPASSNKKGVPVMHSEPAPLSSVLRIHVKIDGKEVFQSSPVTTRDRVLDCTVWKRSSDSIKSASKRPTSQHLDSLYAPNRTLTSLHAQLNVQRSLPGSELFNLSGSTSSLSQRNPRDTKSASSLLTKKSAKLSLSPKLSRKDRHSQPLSSQQHKLIGSLSSGFERKRPPSLSSQPLSRPQSPPLPDYGTPGAPLYLSACVMIGKTQSPTRRLRIVERRGLEPVRIDCSAISNSIMSASHQEIYGNLPSTAPPYHQRLTIPLTPTITDSALQPSLCIRVSSEPNFDESTCYGSLHVELDPNTFLPIDKSMCGPNWYSVKARSKQPITTGQVCHTVAVQPASTSPGPTELGEISGSSSPHEHQQQTEQWKNTCYNGANVGEMKGRQFDRVLDAEFSVHWSYSSNQLLRFCQYEPLYAYLTTNLHDDCNHVSLLTLVQQLPVSLEEIVPPLMKIFVHADQLKPFLCLLCTDYLAYSTFRDDANTLFRSQSIVSKTMYEMMKFVGHDYLGCSMKPLIDLIYAKRECCEVDPARLKEGDVLETNQRRLMVYVELAFSCVVESSGQCPAAMREVFAELRSVVARFFPQREDIERLAVSSFLIMRFFSAAILNPKVFGLKREAPEPDVMRTLVLISKVLQRLANCVVSEKPLTTKEVWLTPVLERVSDPAHKRQMVKFLDTVSNVALSSESTTPSSSVSGASSPLIEDTDSKPSTLKFGHMIERRSGSDKKRSFKNLIHQKKRYVTLTENELTWQKVKEGNEDLEPKGNFAVADIRTVALLPESKHSFSVGTLNAEVHFQANNTLEMNEWMILIEKQQLRHVMLTGRSKGCHHHRTLKIDLEKELELVYSIMERNLSTLCAWRRALETKVGISFGKDSPTSLDRLILGTKSAREQERVLRSIQDTVCRAISLTQQIQKLHKNRDQIIQTSTLKSQPTTPGSPLASPTALLARSMDYQARMVGPDSTPTSPTTLEFPQKDQAMNIVLVDSENYLHLRSQSGGGACKKRVRKAPTTNLYDVSSNLSASEISLGPPPKSPTA